MSNVAHMVVQGTNYSVEYLTEFRCAERREPEALTLQTTLRFMTVLSLTTASSLQHVSKQGDATPIRIHLGNHTSGTGTAVQHELLKERKTEKL